MRQMLMSKKGELIITERPPKKVNVKVKLLFGLIPVLVEVE